MNSSAKGIVFDDTQWRYICDRYGLSAREVQVARLLCQGFSNDQIAELLKIKAGTVKTHLRNLYRRFRVNNKVLLVLAIVDELMEKFYAPAEPPAGRIPIKDLPAQTEPAPRLPAKEKDHP